MVNQQDRSLHPMLQAIMVFFITSILFYGVAIAILTYRH